MGLICLPLHVWDRELDSRILIASMALNDGHEILLGHEYNISSIYSQVPNIFHYGAGRPIFNIPRTTDWYLPLVNNGSFVGITFEEGLNDLLTDHHIQFAGINGQSVLSTTEMFCWCEKEKELMLQSTPDSLRPSLL